MNSPYVKSRTPSRRVELERQLGLLDRLIEAERRHSWETPRYESLLRERRIIARLLNVETVQAGWMHGAPSAS